MFLIIILNNQSIFAVSKIKNNTYLTQRLAIKLAQKLTISQAQLARNYSSVHRQLESGNGESMPDIITLNRLAEILGVDLNYFQKTKKLSILK